MKNILISLILIQMLPSYALNYQSQFGQDKFINDNFFFNKKNGVFIDIGAHDGVKYSNTFSFEKDFGWTGICIEPQLPIFKELQKNRSCTTVNKCISTAEGVEKFIWVQSDRVNTGMLSGLLNTYDPRHLERMKREIAKFGGTFEIIEVETTTLSKLLKENNIYYIDYLTLDTEGGELEILKSIDFDTFHIHIIDVENNYKSPETRTFLESKGFVFIKTLACDEIYCNSKNLK